MKFDEISYTSFLYVLVIHFSPLIFAPWVFPPNKPEDLTIEKTCPEWIEFSGFTLDNYNENRKRTLERIIAFDEEVSVWAAIYAFRIGGEKKLPKLLPGQFCKSLGENMDTIKYTFSALNEENRTCHGWILLYGFSKDNHEYNITYAENQRSDKIYAVSIWAYSFYKFVKTWKTQSIEKTCPEWIEFSGFTLDNYEVNRTRTLYRSILLDKNASSWAAIYAFQIGGKKSPPKLLPGKFCDGLGENMDVIKFKFSALKEETRTCHGWISLYGFSNDDHEYNITYAKNQRLDKMYAVSIWAFSFYKFVDTWKNEFPTTPIDFCNKMGILTDENAKSKEFMNIHGPKLTCKAWMELYEYDDDLDKNYAKAIQLRKMLKTDVNIQLEAHYLPRHYYYFIDRKKLSDIKDNNWTPLEFCSNYISRNNSLIYSFLYAGEHPNGRNFMRQNKEFYL